MRPIRTTGRVPCTLRPVVLPVPFGNNNSTASETNELATYFLSFFFKMARILRPKYLRAQHLAAHQTHGWCSSFVAFAVGAREKRRSVDQFAVIGRQSDQSGRSNRERPGTRPCAILGEPHGH